MRDHRPRHSDGDDAMTLPPHSMPMNPAALLDHADWIRALAAQLVADPATAEDVAQQVWVEAIESPPRDMRNPRGWLAAVARNVARRLRRGEERRSRRERDASRPESTPSTAELVAEASLQRDLVGEILLLDEPYRMTILLRYFREPPIDEIARSLEVPRDTVRTRLARGLDHLRARLDRRHGDRASWCSLLMPLARRASTTVTRAALPAAGGGLAMLAWKVGAAAGIATLAWVVWHRSVDAVSSRPVLVGGSSSVLEHAGGTSSQPEHDGLSGSGVGLARAAIAGMLETPEPGGSTSNGRIAGRVVDLHGRPVADIEVDWLSTKGLFEALGTEEAELPDFIVVLLRENPELLDRVAREPTAPVDLRSRVFSRKVELPRTRTDTDGSFALEVHSTEGVLRSASPAWTIAGEGKFESDESVWVVAPPIDLAGTVTDEQGRSLADVEVKIGVSLRGIPTLAAPLRDERGYDQKAGTDEQGYFRIRRAPCIEGSSLTALAEEFDEAEVAVPPQSTDSLGLVMRRKENVPAPIKGTVVSLDGSPVRGATVCYGQDIAITDKDGGFDLHRKIPGKQGALVAVKKGFQYAIIDEFDPASVVQGADIVLRLGPPPLSIRGRVLLPDGLPCLGCPVYLANGQRISVNSGIAEDEAAGRSIFSGSGLFVSTDAEGRFDLDGLSSRRYDVVATEMGRRLRAELAGVLAGGPEVEIRMETPAVHARLRGRVVTWRDEGIPGVSVGAGLVLSRGSLRSFSYTVSHPVQTDETGRFELTDVPAQHFSIIASSPELEAVDVLVPADPSGEVRIEMEVKVRFQVEPADAADAFELLDENMRPVQATVSVRKQDYQRVEADAGRFPVCEASDRAVTIVLFKDGKEVRRAPIELRRGDLRVIRP